MARPRVLVATDEVETAERIRVILAAEGCEVDTVGQAADALDQFTQYHYDLLITSLRLRDLDGPGLYWAFRARWPLAHPRVIFLVREGEDIPSSAKGLEGPEAPVLPVPFTPEWLRQIARRALGLL